VLLLALGFLAALLFAWIYELTPEGLEPAARVGPQQSTTEQTGRCLDRAIIGVLVVALAYFVADRMRVQCPARACRQRLSPVVGYLRPQAGRRLSDAGRHRGS
jgi:hypothetical protein